MAKLQSCDGRRLISRSLEQTSEWVAISSYSKKGRGVPDGKQAELVFFVEWCFLEGHWWEFSLLCGGSYTPPPSPINTFFRFFDKRWPVGVIVFAGQW